MWQKVISAFRHLDRHPHVGQWVEAITWFAPPLIIPTLRALNDEPELRKKLYIRDASTYMVGTLVFWGIKNILERTTQLKFLPFVLAMSANMLYAGYGAVKLSQWITRQGKLQENKGYIRYNRARSVTNPFRPEDTRYVYHHNPTFATFAVPRPIPPTKVLQSQLTISANPFQQMALSGISSNTASPESIAMPTAPPYLTPAIASIAPPVLSKISPWSIFPKFQGNNMNFQPTVITKQAMFQSRTIEPFNVPCHVNLKEPRSSQTFPATSPLGVSHLYRRSF